MDPTIRHVTSDELPRFVDALTTAFLDRFDVENAAADIRTIWSLDRMLAAFDGDDVVGTFRSFVTELTVPGCARLPASGISAVTVMPAHRRKGLLTRMVAMEHAEARERGEAVELLYAAEYPIYGRFGYGPATRLATWTAYSRTARFRGDPAGSVEIVRIDAASRDAIIPLFDTWRRGHHGEISRLPYRWDFALGLRRSAWDDAPWKGFLALHRDADGTLDGYTRYRAEDYEEHGQGWKRILVDEPIGLDDAARGELWRFLVTMDLVGSVKAEARSLSEPLPWLLVDGREARATDVGDGMWVRLLDVPRALEARTYERSARLVLEVIDAEAPRGRSRLDLDASSDGATCRATDRSPDLTLDVAALSAAYLGGSRLRDATRQHGADEHRPGALAEADALLATLDEPFCSTFF
jgi:predicted acetyltransferase